MSSNHISPNWARLFLEKEIIRLLALYKKSSGRCINIGCGVTGRYADLLEGLDVDGIDIESPSISIPTWRYHQIDARKLPFEDEAFDLAIAIEAFEHIEENEKAMNEVSRVLRKGAPFILTTPSHWTWIFEFGRHGPHYYTQRQLVVLVQESGLVVNDIIPCGGLLYFLISLIKSWLSPFGLRAMGPSWWKVIDGLFVPVYYLAGKVDWLMPLFPTNWVILAYKK